MVIPSGLDQKRIGILECKPQGEWDRVAELMMLKFSESKHPCLQIHLSIVSRSAQKQKEVDKYQYTSALMTGTIETVFRTIFLLISSVFSEQSQICVKNTYKSCYGKNGETCAGRTI